MLQLLLRLFSHQFLFLLFFKKNIVLYLRLFVAVEHVEFLNGASFLRGEVKIVISVMLILALALFW